MSPSSLLQFERAAFLVFVLSFMNQCLTVETFCPSLTRLINHIETPLLHTHNRRIYYRGLAYSRGTDEIPVDVKTTSSKVSSRNAYNLGLMPVVVTKKLKDEIVTRFQEEKLKGVSSYHGSSNNTYNNFTLNESIQSVNWERRNDTLADMGSSKDGIYPSKGNITMNRITRSKSNQTQNDKVAKKQKTKENSLEETENYYGNSTMQLTDSLYTLASSLLAGPPKMKRTKPSPSTLVKSSSSSSSSPAPAPAPALSTVAKYNQQGRPHLISSNQVTPNTPLTLQDLQKVLNENGYVRRDELSTLKLSSNDNKPSMSHNTTSSNKPRKKSKSGVAFPQPSILSTRHIRIGTSISSSVFLMLIVSSLQPNLWLIGSIIGATYGNDIAERSTKINVMDDGTMPLPPGGLYGDISLKLGKRIALGYLQVWDVIQGIWFMYRTGQLSYEYYKTYASLDQKFKIQDKMDAWNARFVEGKKNFDQWEQENEVGRKVLAGLRTIWLVEEKSYKSQRFRIDGRGKRRSKYRIVQYAHDTIHWFQKLLVAIYDAVTGGGNTELLEIVKGIKIQLDELNLETVSQRVGAATAALLAVNVVGAMFAIAPSILAVMAVVTGMIWPNWVGETYQKIKDLLEDTRARGRGGEKKIQNAKKKEEIIQVDKSNFHYFVNQNGRKQWYRTGQSIFSKFDDNESQESFLSPLNNFFRGLNDQNQRPRKSGKKSNSNSNWWQQ